MYNTTVYCNTVSILMIPTIAILVGGFSKEKEISMISGKIIKRALNSISYNAIKVNLDNNIAEKLKNINPDLAFVALYGPYGEDGCIQGLLEILGIKYTHSGVMASAIAMNKAMSKHIFRLLDIDTPDWYTVSQENILKDSIKIKYPYVLKPINEGSSIGVNIIFSYDDYLQLKETFNIIKESDQEEKKLTPRSSSTNSWIRKNHLKNLMIIEEYVPGVELQTAVLLDQAIGTIEIRPKNRFYDYESKYTSGFAKHVFPPEIPNNIYKMTLEYALKVHKFLGCKTISRSDFRYNAKNNSLKMLEINTHPGLTELSLMPKIARLAKGINFNELVKIIVEDSLQRKKNWN